MTQAAVSVLLIVMATLFVRATFRAATIDVGFAAAGLYAVSPGLGDAFDDDGAGIRNFWARAISELQAVPGIAAVTLAELTPFGDATRTSITGDGPARVVIHFNGTRAEYFETIGLRTLAGRTYTRDEVAAREWRMTGDIRDNWPSMSMIGFQQTGREQYAGPGGWNDTDMLVVGMVGWSQGQRPTDLTPNEQLTHLALWSLQAAPLLIGADLSRIDEWTTNILGNREMLAINQDPLGRPAGRKMSDGWVEVWARPLEDGTIAAGLFNRGPEAATVVATWADLGLTGPQPVRDVWLQKDLGRADRQLSADVPRHGVLFVKIGTPKRQR